MRWFGALVVLVASVAAQPIQQAAMLAPRNPHYSSVVVFGDSLVDNGNGTWQLTNHTWPGDKAYYDGRFSNGETWVEVLARKLGVQQVHDVAFGGATVNNTRVQGYTGYNSTSASVLTSRCSRRAWAGEGACCSAWCRCRRAIHCVWGVKRVRRC